MTAKKNLESQLQVYPQYIHPYPVEDEISLVDLWIVLIKYKTTFFASLLVFSILGIMAVSILKTEKYNMNTTISIGQFRSGASISIGQSKSEVSFKVLQPPSAVINKLNFSLLPNLTRQMAKENGINIGIFKTDVSNPKNTNLITIQNKVKESNRTILANLHQAIANSILIEHQELSRVLNSNIQQELKAEILALQELKNPLELVRLSSSQALKLEDEKITLVKLTDKVYLQSKRREFESNIRLFEEKIQTLNEKNKLLRSEAELLISSNEDNLRKSLMLDEAMKNELGINDAGRNKLAMQSEYTDFKLVTALKAARQKILVESLQSVIKLIESNWVSDIKEKESKLVELENRLKGNNTRIINLAELSLQPVGLSKNLAYLLSVVLAIFAAFFVTLIGIFRAKVKERLAEEA